MPKKTKIPAIKNIPPTTERELKIALEAIKEALEVRLGQRGDPLDRAVTVRELVDAGLAKQAPTITSGASDFIPGDDDKEPGDLSIPPAPSGLTANGAFTSIVLKWDNPSYGNHAFTEIWRSKANALGGAELVSTAGGQIYTEEVGYNQSYFYWVRFVSAANIPGPWNDTEGTSATTSVDVGAVLTTLGENLSNLPGYDTLTGLINSASAQGSVAARVIRSSSAPTAREDNSSIQPNDIWFDTDDGQVYTRNSDNDDWVAARDATLVNLFGSTSFTGSTLSAAMATAQGDIVTVTDAQSSTATNLTNLTAKVDTKNQTFIQDNAPADNSTNDLQDGDLWVDSNDGNKMYRWNGSSWVSIQDTSIGTAIANAATAQSTADGKIDSFYQDNAPSSASEGDIWFDTNDGNKVYTRRSGAWVATQDSGIAQALSDAADADAKADGKVTTFVGTSAPTATAIGDLWIDTDDNNKLYRATATGSSNWVAVRDTANDGKTTVFTQADQPTANNTGDIWFDTDDNNKQYRWNGSAWVLVRDVTTQAAVTTEATARANADSAISQTVSNLTVDVNDNTADIATNATAISDEASARATAITDLTAVVDVKNQTFISTSAPTAIAAGDLWIDSDDDNKLYRATAAGNTNWVAVRDTANDGKATVFTQDNVPTSGVKKGDIWFDTNDENKQYRADSDGSDQVTTGEWEVVRDVITQAAVVTEATARADGDAAEATARQTLESKVDLKNQTFISTSAPTAIAAGDLWIDSDDENKLYRATGPGNTNWVAVRDTANDGKTTVFTQTDQPTAENTGDIWFDTDDDNKQYRWDGSNWVLVRDILTQANVTTVQNAISNGTSAQAGYGVAVNANGAVAGIYIMAESDGTLENNTSSTNIIFEANQVTIRDSNSGGTNVTPFTVLTSTDSDGNAPGVYITSALIKNASITAAQIDALSAELVNAVAINAGSITAGTMSADRISGGVIQSTDLSTGGSTNINGANITTGTINAARIDASFIQSSDLGSSGSTVIDGSRITTGQIDAARINVTDLVLPVAHNKVTGSTIGTFLHNNMTVREVGSIGTKPGLYDGYVRINGSDTQVKTLSFFIGDGTFGSGSEIDSTSNTYNNGPNTQNLPMVDIGGVQYHSNRAEAWAGIERFRTAQATAQLAVTFRKRSGTSRTAKLYILAQGDGGARSLDGVEYAFTRLAVNEPVPFTFTDQTQRPTNETLTHSAITLTGAGFTGGTLTLTGDSSAQFKINSGSFQTGSATVTAGDTFTVKLTSSSSQGTTVSCTVTVNNVSDTFSITTATTGSPPGSPPPGNPPSGPPSGPSGPLGEEAP
mgnify:CR=1 FL=1